MNREDIDPICAIADRAEALYEELGIEMPSSRMGLIMDIEHTHDQVPLALDLLLGVDKGTFAHDIAGILRHLNRETKQLEDGFTPRCAACFYDQPTIAAILAKVDTDSRRMA